MAFFKSTQVRQFNYIPLFYDKRKEELQERITAIQKEQNPEEDQAYSPNLKGQFKRRHQAYYGKPGQVKNRSIARYLMLIIYAGLVIAIIYMIMNLLTQVQ